MKEKDILTVKLTYFKPSGKFYTSSTMEVLNRPINEIFDKIENLLKQGIRPGLSYGHSGFHVLIEIPEHENNQPCLLVGKG